MLMVKDEHLDYQRRYFDEKVEVFRSNLPEDVRQRMGRIVDCANLRRGCRVLDVGTGTGVLIPYFLKAGVIPKDILGCDLSTEMLSEARQRFPDIKFWQGDVAELPITAGSFDGIFFNACFGNIYDPLAALTRCSNALTNVGKIVVSHPMGNDFVAKLKSEDPKLVLKLLPEESEWQAWAEELNLDATQYLSEPDLYIAVMQRRLR